MKKLKLILLAILVFALLSFKLTQPFWGHHEFNGVFYGMIAKNYLRYGYSETLGAQVTNFYPVSSEKWSLHTHHPATYPLMISIFFKLFGVDEYVSRFISITASIIGIIFLVKLVDLTFSTPYAWLGAITIVFTPLFLYYGSLPVFEPLLFPVVVFGLYRYWKDKSSNHLRWVILACVIAPLIDWPGFWLPIWLTMYEILTQKRRRVVLALSASIILSLSILLLHQIIATGTLADIAAVGRYRLGVTKQPYTNIEWIRLLLTRIRAFFGLPVITSAGLGFVYAFWKQKKDIFLFLSITLGLGLSHIFIFRNITWYHDYMLYHLLPFLVLALGAMFQALSTQTRSELVVIVVFLIITVTTATSTNAFFKALVNLEPHKDCVEMGYRVRTTSEELTFSLSSEKAKECPPFIGYYGEKPFIIAVED